jgi:hypothetical protein
MRNLISATTTAAVFSVATIVLAAQSPSPTTSGQNPGTQPSGSQSSTPSAASPSSSSANQITVTGCLQAAEPGATGTSGTAGTTGTANGSGQSKFVLTGAKMGGGADAANTTTAPASASGRTYRLIANDAALSPHLNKKLELTGTIDSTSAATTTAGDSPSTGASANSPMLRVESGKIIADSCSDETPAAAKP